MNVSIRQLRKNAGAIIAAINVVLLILIFFVQDPLSLFQSGYGASRVVLVSSQTQVKKIEIFDPQQAEKKFILIRGKRVASQKGATKRIGFPPKKKIPTGPEFEWKLRLPSLARDSKPVSYRADAQRIKNLFAALSNAKRYFALKRNPKNDRKYGLGKNATGKYNAPQLSVTLTDGSHGVLYIGRSMAGKTYVRMNEEDDIFQIESDIKNAAGFQDPLYFRNRAFFAPKIDTGLVSAIKVVYTHPVLIRATGGDRLLLQKSKNDWQMIAPISGPARNDAVRSVLKDIAELRISSFLDQIPAGLDRKKAMSITLSMSGEKAGSNSKTIAIIGQKGFGDYVIRGKNGELYLVNSVFLSDLQQPISRLLRRRAAQGR